MCAALLPEVVSVANEDLGGRVESLADKADAIIAALDELFTCAVRLARERDEGAA